MNRQKNFGFRHEVGHPGFMCNYITVEGHEGFAEAGFFDMSRGPYSLDYL